MIAGVRKEPCKKVPTVAADGSTENGYLIELFKDGEKTPVYLAATFPRGFKGYHLHRVRKGRFVCLRGKVKMTVVEGREKEEIMLDAATPERLFLPTNVYIGIENIGGEEAWLVNYPDPPYDPSVKGEQLEKTPEDIAAQLTGA